jgi:hypothetical protein
LPLAFIFRAFGAGKRLFVQSPDCERIKSSPVLNCVAWRTGDEVSLDEIKAMAELILNNFASALMCLAHLAIPVKL